MSNFKGRTKLDLWKNEGYFWINVIKKPSTSWFIKISIHQKKTRLEPFNNKIYWKSLSNKSGLAFANQIWKRRIIIILEVGVISLSLSKCVEKHNFHKYQKTRKEIFRMIWRGQGDTSIKVLMSFQTVRIAGGHLVVHIRIFKAGLKQGFWKPGNKYWERKIPKLKNTKSLKNLSLLTRINIEEK